MLTLMHRKVSCIQRLSYDIFNAQCLDYLKQCVALTKRNTTGPPSRAAPC